MASDSNSKLQATGYVSSSNNGSTSEINAVEKYLPLHNAILQGNWEIARKFFEQEPDAVIARLTASQETPLLVAIKRGKGIHIVKKLVELMAPGHLALTDLFGNTALHAAAVLGNPQAARLIVQKNSDLPYIWNIDGSLPLHLAAMHHKKEMTLYLFSVTRDYDDLKSPHEIEAGATLMRVAIDAGLYDMALFLLQRNTKLAWEGISPLEVMAEEPSAFPSGTPLNFWQRLIYNSFPNLHPMLCSVLQMFVPPIKQICQTKLMHHQALELVKRLCMEIIVLNNGEASSVLKSPFLLAAQNGIHEIVEEILESFPNAITFVDEENHTALHLAVIYRQEKVFNIMHQQSGQRKRFMSLLQDSHGDNILHLVGYRAHQHRLELSSGSVLIMQRELQWYKEVEKFVVPQVRKSKNDRGKTPLMLFNEEHTELITHEGQWMIGMATSYTVAASLFATVAFAAAITVPGGNNSNGFPIFFQEKAFTVFIVSVAFALLSSITSVLAFLSIFTSRYAVIDFLYALPNRLIIGLIALFLSVTLMMIAFSSVVYIGSQKNASTVIPAVAFACVPITLFGYLQLPPLLNMIKSTYGPSIFIK